MCMPTGSPTTGLLKSLPTRSFRVFARGGYDRLTDLAIDRIDRNRPEPDEQVVAAGGRLRKLDPDQGIGVADRQGLGIADGFHGFSPLGQSGVLAWGEPDHRQ